MTSGLKVINPGTHTTLQDWGRFGYQHLGVPVSGALDLECFELANALVGNPDNTASLEILYFGPTFEVTQKTIRIAVAGYGTSIEITGPEPARYPAWRSLDLVQGQTFRILLEGTSTSAYMAVAGGFDIPSTLGSLSTYRRAGLGGQQGRPLQAGDTLPLSDSNSPVGHNVQLSLPPYDPSQPIRVIWSIQKDWFTEQSLNTFVSEPFIIQPESDRMGCRLAGPEITHKETSDIISDGIATGAIQVPGSKQPIIMLSDHQTTGGYPKIANVISADLPRMGRIKPGQEIRFAVVDVAGAEQIRRDQHAKLVRMKQNLDPVSEQVGIDLKVLYEANLISGVVDDSE